MKPKPKETKLNITVTECPPLQEGTALRYRVTDVVQAEKKRVW